MKELMFKAKVLPGAHLEFEAPQYVASQLQVYDNQHVHVNIRKYSPKRSIKQNNWYYGVAIPLIQAYIYDTQGEKYTKDEINQFHLNTVIQPKLETKAIFGKVCIIYDIKRTSEMTTGEFMNFKDKIQMYWAERDLILPDPEQAEFL